MDVTEETGQAIREKAPILMADLSEHYSYHRSSGVPDDDLYGRLLELMEGPEWHQQAKCRGMGAALFFPERGELTAHAKAVCRRCPVKEECAAAGLYEHFGVWGETTERERRRIRRRGRYAELRRLGWCSPCASGTHPDCRGCPCIACRRAKAS